MRKKRKEGEVNDDWREDRVERTETMDELDQVI